MKKFGISLAVIVKNESDRIVDFLRHHKPLVKEMIVLDTGSADNTAELAAGEGADVHHFQWTDDFSAARNAAMQQAHCRWVLCIDADERIATRDFNTLKRAAQHKECVYVMPQRNYYNNPQHSEWMPVNGSYPTEENGQSGYFVASNTKFFSRKTGLQFEGRIHESLIASAKRNRIPIVNLNIPIHHYGYVISNEHNLDRNERYGRLLKQKYLEHPGDVQAMEEYATHLIQMKQFDTAFPILEALDRNEKTNSNITRARILLATLKRGGNDVAGAGDVLRRAVAYDPTSIFPYVELLKFLANQRLFADMKPILDKALTTFGENPLLLRELSRYLIETRQIHEAALVARKVAGFFPSMPEYAQLAERCEALSLKVKEIES